MQFTNWDGIGAKLLARWKASSSIGFEGGVTLVTVNALVVVIAAEPVLLDSARAGSVGRVAQVEGMRLIAAIAGGIVPGAGMEIEVLGI